MDLRPLSEIAITAALAAGKIIIQNMGAEISVQQKEGGSSYASQVVTAVDHACERAIISSLLPSAKSYDLALLSEESPDDGERFIKDHFWCIDPMDGTLAFVENRSGFAVSIALVAKDGTPIIGVVYDPLRDNLYHAIRDKGAFRNQLPWEINNKNKHLTYVTDKALKDTPQSTKISSILVHQANRLNLEGVVEITGGGAVLNAIRVLEHGPACMLKLPKKETGGGCIWDYAATACIYQELGLLATTFDREKLDLNKKTSCYMNDKGVYFANLAKTK